MGKGYLIDTNTIIDFFNGRLPEDARKFVVKIEPRISIITQIELFSKRELPEPEFYQIKEFVEISEIFLLDAQIALKTIDIRIKYKTKLPDAVIAATALHHNLVLITRNVQDFRKIIKLEVIDPYNL